MGLGKDFLNNLGERLSGSLPKAILCVRSSSKMGGDTKEAEMSSAQKALKLMERTRNSLTPNLQAAGDLLFGSDSKGKQLVDNSSEYIELEVQYNPASIVMDTQAGRQVKSSADNPNQINITQQPTATTLSFQLVFDNMNIADAFAVNQGLTVSNAVTTISSIAHKVNGKEYTIKDKMDGIMSLLMEGATRQVIFFWSQMCFRGELTNVNSCYTMFNKEGLPIRGTLDLTIRQGEATNDKARIYDESYWGDKFDKVFGIGGISMDFSDNGIGSAAGNILNLWM